MNNSKSYDETQYTKWNKNNDKKEILNKLLKYFKESNINDFGYEQDKLISYEEAQILLDYITNLQEDYDRAMKLVDKGVENSYIKIKEQQKEIEKLTAESTEWESKCYDLQKENERLKEELQQEKKDFKEANDYCFELKDYKSRCDKTIEDIDKFISGHYIEGKGDITVNYLVPNPCCEDRLNIIKKDLLGGDD